MKYTTPRIVRALARSEIMTDRQAELALDAYRDHRDFHLRTLDGRIVQAYPFAHLKFAINHAIKSRRNQ